MTTLDRAEVVLGANDRPLRAGLARAQSAMKSAGRRMQRAGRRLSMAVTLPLAAVGGASVKAFADFDQAMTESIAIMGDVSDTMRGEMEEAARQVSQTTTKSSEEAAESFFFLASAGLDAKQSVAALPQVAKFAQAGMFDMSTATDLATDAQSALGLASEDAQKNLEGLKRVTDTLVGANTLANASVQQFSEALTNRAAAALRAANKELEEGVAVLSAFADQGLKGRRAGTFLARILRRLSKSAAENTKEFRKLGLIDTEGNLTSMANIVEILTNETQGLSDAAKSARLEQLGFTARIQAAIKPLLGTSDAIREYEGSLRNMSGVTAEVSDNQMESFKNQLILVKNNIENAAIEIGERLAPMVLDLAQNIGRLATKFSEMDSRMQDIILKVGGLAAAAGPLLFIAGSLVRSFGALAGVLSAKVVAAVVAVTAVVEAFRNNWFGVRDAAIDAFDALLAAAEPALSAIGDAFRPWVNLLIGSLHFIGSVAAIVWNEFKEDFVTAFETIKGWAKTVLGGIGQALRHLGRLGDEAADAIVGLFDDAAEEGQKEGASLGEKIAAAAVDSFSQDFVAGFAEAVGVGVERARELLGEVRAQFSGGGSDGSGSFTPHPNTLRALGLLPPRDIERWAQKARETLNTVLPFDQQVATTFTGLSGQGLFQQLEEGRKEMAKGPGIIGTAMGGFEFEDPGEDAGDSFMDGFGRRLERGAQSAMQALLSGLIRGKQDIEETLVRIGLSLAASLATQGLFAGLGIASPAQKGIFAGEMLGEGLAVGMENTVRRVRQAASSVAVTAASAAATGGASVATPGAAGSVSARDGVIDASSLDPMGQVAAHVAMESPSLQRLFTAGTRDAARRRGER